MHEKTKFYIFLIAIIALLIAVLWMKKIYSPQYYYANRKLQLDFSNKKSLSDEKKIFIIKIVRGAQLSNDKILKERALLRKIKRQYQQRQKIYVSTREQMEKLMKKYAVKINEKRKEEDEIERVLDELDMRVQIVPVRLAVAQAIIESAWGNSRFAKQGHAYFGIHCYQPGCGIPFGSVEKKVYVKSYKNLQASIEDYMLFLNSMRATRKFREVRKDYLSSSTKNIIHLAESLTAYSEIGGEYHQILAALFKKNIPNHIEDY